MKASRSAIAAAIAWLIVVSPLFAQDGEGSVFAPYPSRIRIGVRGSDIVLTWEDSPDIVAGYAVFRTSVFPDAANFNTALLLGYSDTGSQEFVYTPGDEKPYYYFVLGRVAEGAAAAEATEYRLFIPLRNVPIEPVAVAVRTAAPEELAASAPQEAEAKPRLSGILSRADGDAVVVSVDAQGDVGRLIVYRGTSPILSSARLLDAALAAIVEPYSGPYRDYPVPGVDYYYAVVPERDLASGKISLEPGVNATVVPASIAAGAFRVGLPSSGASSRSMPLPYLVLTRGFEDAKPVGIEDPTPRTRTLSAETEKAIAKLASSVGSTTKADRPLISIFPEDLQSGGGGEEYALRSIVSGYLSKGSYAEASRQFTLYLSLPRSAKNAGRARFYRGQAQAMTGAYREAFFDFLQIQDAYYLESSAWIDYILEELRRG
ncbi:MAG: hypothetical protein CVV47_17065 [Spirochaetae bacterium HGW-Spirochaetae-3]|jgi:hypothetical protein|nr:MAG: hypothetical protein CVV47_17065 [Spirochaetae bacterium HGW-Spirochaetae-3]